MPKVGFTRKKELVRLVPMAAWMGVDPGIKGGISLIYGRLSVEHWAMPETLADLADIIDRIEDSVEANGGTSLRVVIERVNVMPKQGISSVFTFGRGYGRLEALLVRFQCEDIPPQTWMKALSIPPGKKGQTKSQQKKKLRAKAQQLFPSLPIWKKPRSVGEQMAICDSLLIAHYCRLRYPNG